MPVTVRKVRRPLFTRRPAPPLCVILLPAPGILCGNVAAAAGGIYAAVERMVDSPPRPWNAATCLAQSLACSFSGALAMVEKAERGEELAWGGDGDGVGGI